MRISKREVKTIISFLEEVWENEESLVKRYSSLKGKTPFQILVSTILSLRTKDEITYSVASELFKDLKEARDFVEISTKELERMIYPVGFYRNKAKAIKKIAKEILEKYGGNVPANIDDLLNLPGVGRKTANLVLSTAFGKNVICVDTHVHRISNRLGLVNTKTPEETEVELMKVLPKNYWKKINHLMVSFGQTICKPVKPRCDVCKLVDLCKYYQSLRR
ncbi:MAG: endonuclease III [Brevinematia bacterium]